MAISSPIRVGRQLACAALIWAMAVAEPASATTITVPGDYPTISEAVGAAAESDEIVVSPGVYSERLYVSKNIILRSTNPTDPVTVAATAIDGYQAGPVVTFSGSEGSSCVLSGFTIRNGNTSNGGGIVGNETHARIEYNTIVGNSADSGGGLYGCHGTIRNNTITSNSARWSGGGLYSCDGTIQGNTITHNTAYRGGGGGLFDCEGTVQYNTVESNRAMWGGGMRDCNGLIGGNTIAANEATNGGGLYDCDGTIQGNIIAGNSVEHGGGGLSECSGAVVDNTIRANSALFGGGLYACHGMIQNNTITGNYGWHVGGGLLYCAGVVQNNTITENRAGHGSGLFNCDGTIQNNIISGNFAWENGGGLYGCDGPIHGNTITGNSAKWDGGGLCYCDGTIENNIISDNSASGGRWEEFPGGGGLFRCNGTIQNNLITGNSVERAGGQQLPAGGGLNDCNGTIQNNIIAGNSTNWDGGGLYKCDGTIANNTIVGNSAGFGGGASNCTSLIVNCIFWGNSAAGSPQIHNSAVPIYSCIEGYTGGGQGNIAQNPRFVGPDDYHLQADSPCIDAGTNDHCPATDKDGSQRPLDGNHDGQAACDMGAYEYVGPWYADLVVTTGSVAPEQVNHGRLAQVSLQVRNAGLGTPGTHWTHVYLSTDGVYGADDFLWIAGILVPPLDPGEQFNYVVMAIVPALAAGQYHVLVQCDVLNEVPEPNEQNNLLDIGTLTLPTRAGRWPLYR